MMSDIVYINNAFLAQREAKLSILDRSVLFSDAVYEVICVWDGQLLDYKAHIERLASSIDLLSINYKVDSDKLLVLCKELITKNNLTYGLIYIQVTRGACMRDFVIDQKVKPSIFMFSTRRSLEDFETLKQLKLKSFLDERWGLCNIKTTQLLYASLKKSEAQQCGKDDALFVKNGFITEASSANFYIIDHDNNIITAPLTNYILPGITRATLLNKVAKSLGLMVKEQHFALKTVYDAKEAFISSASSFVQAVVEIDGKLIGTGQFGEISKAMRLEYFKQVERV